MVTEEHRPSVWAYGNSERAKWQVVWEQRPSERVRKGLLCAGVKAVGYSQILKFNGSQDLEILLILKKCNSSRYQS
jgi:hypothetical protein